MLPVGSLRLACRKLLLYSCSCAVPLYSYVTGASGANSGASAAFAGGHLRHPMGVYFIKTEISEIGADRRGTFSKFRMDIILINIPLTLIGGGLRPLPGILGGSTPRIPRERLRLGILPDVENTKSALDAAIS